MTGKNEKYVYSFSIINNNNDSKWYLMLEIYGLIILIFVLYYGIHAKHSSLAFFLVPIAILKILDIFVLTVLMLKRIPDAIIDKGNLIYPFNYNDGRYFFSWRMITIPLVAIKDIIAIPFKMSEKKSWGYSRLEKLHVTTIKNNTYSICLSLSVEGDNYTRRVDAFKEIIENIKKRLPEEKLPADTELFQADVICPNCNLEHEILLTEMPVKSQCPCGLILNVEEEEE